MLGCKAFRTLEHGPPRISVFTELLRNRERPQHGDDGGGSSTGTPKQQPDRFRFHNCVVGSHQFLNLTRDVVSFALAKSVFLKHMFYLLSLRTVTRQVLGCQLLLHLC